MVSAAILPLAIAGIEVRRRGRRILGPIDWRLEGEGITIVIGPNGAGKTTFLRSVHGLERLSRGTVRWSVADDEARKRQAFVFQSPVVMRRSVADCIAYPLRLDGVPKPEARARAAQWAGRVGLESLLDRPAEVLSRGERQKLALVRALVREPEVLFLDEPCASLDGAATHEIEQILAGVRDHGARIVMSTHDMGQARRLATEVIFLHQGRMHESAMAADFFAAPQTAEARAFLRGDIVT